MHHTTDKIAHTTAFFTPVVAFVILVVEHWLELEIAHGRSNRTIIYYRRVMRKFDEKISKNSL